MTEFIGKYIDWINLKNHKNGLLLYSNVVVKTWNSSCV